MGKECSYHRGASLLALAASEENLIAWGWAAYQCTRQSREKFRDLLESLLIEMQRAGVQINARSQIRMGLDGKADGGITALFYANEHSLPMLIQMGIDPTLLSLKNENPLHHLIKTFSFKDITPDTCYQLARRAKAFIEVGVAFDLPNHEGKTFGTLARTSGSSELSLQKFYGMK